MNRKDRDRLKARLVSLFQSNPEAKKVENRYRSIRVLLELEYPLLFEVIKDVPKDTILKFLKDTVYLDRQVRLFSEGSEKEKKQILSDDFVVKEII